MKTGEFIRKYNISKDAVRHYINIGLLIPDGCNTKYNFTERECRDIEIILKMKNQRFSLQQIHRFLDIVRVSNMTEPESNEAVLEIFHNKKNELEQEIKDIRQICSSLQSDIEKFSPDVGTFEVTGVPINALRLFACPFCGDSLRLENASLNSKYILNANLECSCGYKAKIGDGILRTGNMYTAPYDKPDLMRGLYRDVSENFVSYMQKCADNLLEELKKRDLKNRVVLEGHINGYFFLYNNLKRLEKNCVYIITDKYPEMLEMYKRNIDRMNLGLDILYIADAKMELPLMAESVDILISFMADNEHSLYFKNSYVHDIKKYLKNDALIAGARLGYKREAKSLEKLAVKYPEGDISGFSYDDADEIYRKEGYEQKCYTVGKFDKSTKKYSFTAHIDGEQLAISSFRAENNMC